MSGADPVLSALQRCTRKAASASDGRGVSGAVREARNGLQHAGIDAATAGRMADAAGRLGVCIGHRARVGVAELVQAWTIAEHDSRLAVWRATQPGQNGAAS